nr:hypothetical protein Itr_chr14CG16880 [Ipomoea trifida]
MMAQKGVMEACRPKKEGWWKTCHPTKRGHDHHLGGHDWLSGGSASPCGGVANAG